MSKNLTAPGAGVLDVSDDLNPRRHLHHTLGCSLAPASRCVMKWSLSEIVRNWHRRGGLDEVEDQSMEATQLDPDVEAHLRAADVTCDHVGRTAGVL